MSPDLAALIQTYVSALERGDPDAAQAAVDEAVAVAPSSAEAWGCRGEFYRHYGHQLTIALDCFERASVLDPGSHLGPGCAAAVCEELEQPALALEHWEEAIQRSPGHPDLWRGRARLKDQSGDFAGALADLEEAIRLAPAEVDGHCLRGEVLLRAQEFEPALRAFERALRVARGHVRAACGRAEALAVLGRVSESNLARPRAELGELRELSRVIEGQLVTLRYRVRPEEDGASLAAQGRTWLATLPRPEPGSGLIGLCGWRLEIQSTPGGLVLAEFDLERRPWRAAVPRHEVTLSLRAEVTASAILDLVGVPGCEVELSQSARICPEALARGGRLRLLREAPASPADSGWRIGPAEPAAFARATRQERFGLWPPLEFVLQETLHLLPYLTLPEGFEVVLDQGELVSIRDSAGQDRLAA
jgi:tetratricopeptide repeat protein